MFFRSIAKLFASCINSQDREENKPSVKLLSKEDEASVTIQKNVRGFLARKKYGIRHLKQGDLTDYKTFIIGNEPKAPGEITNFKNKDEKIALIGTSGLRSVSLACLLGNLNHIPKIIIVDNSKAVYAFWDAIRNFMRDDSQTGTQELFFNNLSKFLSSHNDTYRDGAPGNTYLKLQSQPGREYFDQDPKMFFEALIKRYGYDYIRAILCHTSCIKQSWEDEETFIKIKNILNYQSIDKIYMYPSNIVAYTNDKKIKQKILENIEKTAPVISIHSDLCTLHNIPEKLYVFTNQNPSLVAPSIFLPTICSPLAFLQLLQKKASASSQNNLSTTSISKQTSI